MKAILLLGFLILIDLYSTKAQSCLDSMRIKCYIITPVPGSNYDQVMAGKQKRMTDFVFVHHSSYKYFLPLDSVKGEKTLNYWLRNYKLLEKNKFSTSDHWLIEKRMLECCNQVIKLSPWSNSGGEGVSKTYNLAEFNDEVIFKVKYIDGNWSQIKVDLAKEGEFLNAEPLLRLKPSDTVLNLFILRSIYSVKEFPDPTISLD